MLYDVYQIGVSRGSASDQSNLKRLYRTDSTKNLDYVLSINFECRDKEAAYTGVEIAEISHRAGEKYLLRKDASNGPNFGPAAIKVEYQKTVEKKLLPWFQNAKKLLEAEKKPDSAEVMGRIGALIHENLHKICGDLQAADTGDKKSSVLIIVKLNGKLPYDCEEILYCYKKMIEDKVIGAGDQEGICCLCKEKKRLIDGVNVFKFYTKDKPGFILGGCRDEVFWRNCPVCPDCEPILREGKKYMTEHLKFRFYGLDYYILPSTLRSETNEELLELLADLNEKQFSFKSTSVDAFHTLNEDIFDHLKDQEDISSFHILFLRQEQSAERILLDMKDIYPSRFQELYRAKEKIKPLLREFTDEGFGFGFYRSFLLKTEKEMRNTDLDKLFLSLTQAVFLKEPFKMDLLLPHYLREIRNALHDGNGFDSVVTKAWFGVRYLYEIGCLHYQEERDEQMKDEKIREFMQQYDAGLDTGVKQSLFLTGAFIMKVLHIQAYNLNGAKPFMSHLKELKLRQEDVEGVLKDAYNKMLEYDSFSKESQRILDEIYHLQFQQGKWPLSTNQINYYIAGGMRLMPQLYAVLEEDKNE